MVFAIGHTTQADLERGTNIETNFSDQENMIEQDDLKQSTLLHFIDAEVNVRYGLST